MKKLFTNIALCFGALVFLGLAGSVAQADIIFLGPRVVQPSGQGVVPTVLTLQDKNKDGFERGAVVYAPNNPQAGKRGARDGDVHVEEVNGEVKNGVNSKTILISDLISDAGVRSASDLGIFLDIVEPGNDRLLTIAGRDALVLTVYGSNGEVLDTYMYTGEARNLVVTEGQGGGKSDYVFGLDATQAARLQRFFATPGARLGLGAVLGSVDAGPDQFFFGSLGGSASPTPPPPEPIPEPATMLLLGSGLVGIAAKVRSSRRRKNT